tara:strand:+ start:170 stop:1990 length:1821 start_codon:yes stop_codon:yes gene_type:complete
MNHSYKKIIQYVKPYKFLLIFSLLSSLLYVFMNSLSIWIVGSLIAKIMLPNGTITTNTNNSTSINLKLNELTNQIIGSGEPITQLKSICFLLFIIYLLKNIFFYCNNISISFIQNIIIRDIRSDIFKHITLLPINFYKKTKTSEIASIIIRDIAAMRSAFSISIQKLIVEPINILFFLILLIIISPLMTLITIPTIIVSGIIIIFVGKSIRRKAKRSSKQIAGLMNVLNESLNGIRIIKAFNNEKNVIKKFKKENEKYFYLVFRQAKLGHIAIPINDLIGVSIGVILLWYGGSSVLNGSGLSPENFMRFIILLFAVMQPARKLANVNSQIQSGLASADRAFAILDQPIEIKGSPNSKVIKSFNDSIIFENINFKYDNNNILALKNINLKINKGQKIALVGTSGAGKSTIADLIPRFYNPLSGIIKIDETNIKEITIKSLRSIMGIVTQDTILFNTTIEKNIAYGMNDASIEDVITASKIANAHDFIKKLPNGYKTILDEKGMNLSGGQRQRLSIARALLKNPPIIILDEATSNLDTVSENKVKNAFSKLMKDRTAIIIAHRLSTISEVDKIFVLKDGQIIEEGSHNELLEKNNEYKKLYNLQYNQK